MTKKRSWIHVAAATIVAASLVVPPALADKPSWAGNGKGNSERSKGKGQGRGNDDRQGDRRFEDRHRVVVREYYVKEFNRGVCPPGLAKKRNGCMPPGQAKKWRIGQPLPREVVYHDLPPALVVEIGVPPPGYRYVRVASDILLIAIGTAMVVDAIQDLGRL